MIKTPYQIVPTVLFTLIGTAALWGTFGARRRPWVVSAAIAAYVLLGPVLLWPWQFLLTHRTPVGTGYIVNATVSLLILIAGIVVWCVIEFHPVGAAALVVYAFSNLLQFFSYIYWSYGTAQNFNAPLTHLDALYFSLGTLTTAGTGSIVPISELARRLQTIQMFLDLALVVFAVTLVLARYSTPASDRKRR